MDDVQPDLLQERYGTAGPGRRRLIVLVSGLIGVLALVWLGWATWFQGTPEVQSSLRTFDVVDTHTVNATVILKPRSAEVSANCLLRAFAADHSVVGELNFTSTGTTGNTLRQVRLRTEREATSVELVGCTAPGQSRPR